MVRYQASPSGQLLEHITTYLLPIAGTYARKCSLTREDRQDAEQEIYLYMLEILNSPLTQHTYDNTLGKANSFFTQVARTKAWNIGSARTTRTRFNQRLNVVMDYGPFVWVENEYDYE